MGKLLTPARANHKTAKRAEAYEAVIMHLSPLDLAVEGKNVCPFASKGCGKACLNTSGMGQVKQELAIIRANLEGHHIHRARMARTRRFWEDRGAFLRDLDEELANLERRALRKGRRAVARLNGTSDLSWEAFGVPQRHPHTLFYDYAKSAARALASVQRESWPGNYHLTFSRTEHTSVETIRELLGAGVNVAVVFRDRLPDTWLGAPVLDGTEHDWRFEDPAGVVVGLVALGRAKRDETGFVVDLGEDE